MWACSRFSLSRGTGTYGRSLRFSVRRSRLSPPRLTGSKSEVQWRACGDPGIVALSTSNFRRPEFGLQRDSALPRSKLAEQCLQGSQRATETNLFVLLLKSLSDDAYHRTTVRYADA